jgi:hypothetical protein
MSVRVTPIARILAIAYAVFGIVAFLQFAVSSVQYLTLPFGVVAPLVHLNLNLNLARSTNVYYNLFLCLASVVSYSLTGWLTGAVVALCFNQIAKYTGGVDAKYVSVVDNSGLQPTQGNHPINPAGFAGSKLGAKS